MRNDQIFVLLLVVLLPMSGCFDGGGVGEAEGSQDSTDSSGTTVVNHYYNNTTTSQNSQEKVWHSSSDAVNRYWNDGQDVASGQQRCLEYGPSYDSDTGAYLGEECKETGLPSDESDWNGTNCNGDLSLSSTSFPFTNNWAYAPTCTVVSKTLTTNSGEALILYEMQSITISTTCDGIFTSTKNTIGDREYVIVPGSGMNCNHEISYTQSYQTSSSTALSDMKVLSLVYAIQDTVVV
jgi:hypothetical protein